MRRTFSGFPPKDNGTMKIRRSFSLLLVLINSDPSVTALDAALSCGFNSASGFYKALGDVCGKGGVRSLRQGKERG